MEVTRYSGRPDPWATLAAELQQRGIEADALRLAETSAAIKSRQQVDTKADIDRVRRLAREIKKARRAEAVTRSVWAMNPTSANREALSEDTARRNVAERALLEELCNDRQLFNAALRSVS